MKKKVEKDGKKMLLKISDKKEPTNKFEGLNDDIVNNVIAEEMRQCWRKMGKGEIKVFENDLLEGRKAVCLICSQINFDKGVGSRIVTGLPNYLDNIMPFQNKNKKETYNQFLLKLYTFQIDLWPIPWLWYGDQSVQFLDKEGKFDTRKQYLIFFKGFKGNQIGFQEDWYYIFVTENDKISDLCFMLYN